MVLPQNAQSQFKTKIKEELAAAKQNKEMIMSLPYGIDL